MWMECIRPSFQMMNIFDTGTLQPDRDIYRLLKIIQAINSLAKPASTT